MTDTWTCPVCHKELTLKYEYDDYAKYRKWDHYMIHTKAELVNFIEFLGCVLNSVMLTTIGIKENNYTECLLVDSLNRMHDRKGNCYFIGEGYEDLKYWMDKK